MFGEGAMTDPMCQKWFVKFYAGDFSLEDAPQSGRPLKLLTIKWRHPLKLSTLYSMGIAGILKISKLSMKIICTSLVMLTALMFGFHIS